MGNKHVLKIILFGLPKMDCPDCVSVKVSSQNVTKIQSSKLGPQKVTEIGVNVFRDINLNIKQTHRKNFKY